jgi:hypothetical protein
VDVRHETDLGEYDQLVGSEDLSQSGAAALGGSAGGMAVALNDQSTHYGEAQFDALLAPAYRYRFYLDPNGLTMLNWKNFVIGRTRSGWTARQWVVLRYRDGLHELRLVVRDDGNTVHYSAYQVISDAEHYVEVLVRHASSAAAEDGLAVMTVDGAQSIQLAGLDLYDADKRPNNIQLGAVSGVDAGTSGMLYLDELILKDAEDVIGPAAR